MSDEKDNDGTIIVKTNKVFGAYIHAISSITHAHLRSLVACRVYIQLEINILRGFVPKTVYEMV